MSRRNKRKLARKEKARRTELAKMAANSFRMWWLCDPCDLPDKIAVISGTGTWNPETSRALGYHVIGED